jgi:glycosyltransferase involved in cell wall biosynthesis
MRATEPRRKIAYFVPPSPVFAGIERVVHEIATGLAEEFADVWDVHVVFATAYDDAMLETPAYTKHVLGVERLRSLARPIRSCVASNRFDVLVCPQVEPAVTVWGATRGLGLPIFLAHLHGNPRIEERDGSRSTRAAFALFRRVVAPRIAGILTVSPSLERYAAESLAPGVPVVFVPNPVREFNAPERALSPDGTFRFVSVARLDHQKGQDVLLRAVAQARSRLPRFHLTLVGSGPEEDALKRLARALGVEDVVTFTGYITDPLPHLVDADCFVLASRWEGFGVALVEALGVGLPLLSTDCDFGPADIITEPTLGSLVPTDDPAALADGLVGAVRRRDAPDDVARRKAAAAQYSRAAVSSHHAAVLERFYGDAFAPPAAG